MGIDAFISLVGLGLTSIGGMFTLLFNILNASRKADRILMAIEQQLKELHEQDRKIEETLDRFDKQYCLQADSLERLARSLDDLDQDIGEIFKKLKMQRRDRSQRRISV